MQRSSRILAEDGLALLRVEARLFPEAVEQELPSFDDRRLSNEFVHGVEKVFIFCMRTDGEQADLLPGRAVEMLGDRCDGTRATQLPDHSLSRQVFHDREMEEGVYAGALFDQDAAVLFEMIDPSLDYTRHLLFRIAREVALSQNRDEPID